MDFTTFQRLRDKPVNKTHSAYPLSDQFALDFESAGPELLDDFSSFEDLMEVGIETSWEEDFGSVFPDMVPLACADMDQVEDFDSYAEFLILVDTSEPECPVYFFSAGTWDWDEWDESGNGCTLMAESFEEFYEGLTAFDGGES